MSLLMPTRGWDSGYTPPVLIARDSKKGKPELEGKIWMSYIHLL